MRISANVINFFVECKNTKLIKQTEKNNEKDQLYICLQITCQRVGDKKWYQKQKDEYHTPSNSVLHDPSNGPHYKLSSN